MFERLGSWVSAHWAWVLAGWIVAIVGLHMVAPPWDEVTLDGDFAYLPDRMTSIRGEKLLAAAFPDAKTKSQLVLVLARDKGQLEEQDYALAEQLAAKYTPKEDEKSPVVMVWDYRTEVFGRRMVSRATEHGQAMLVMLHMTNEFMAINNLKVIGQIYKDLKALRQSPEFPKGLEIGATGSAALGADILFSSGESIKNTERTTVALVVIILLMVYRAPGLVLVPLLTIAASVDVSKSLVALLALASHKFPWLHYEVYKTSEIFIIVILFGAGTDFCLFLIARYREELQRGLPMPRAISYSLSQVGGALAGSALTTILGLGMMFFADFGKFRYGGPTIAIALVVALLASLTLGPSLLRLSRQWVFWPFHIRPVSDANGDVGPKPSRFWVLTADAILARPGIILLASIALLLPLAVKGLSIRISYNLVNELGGERESVRGLTLLQRHFPVGETGPITLLAYQPNAQFDSQEGQRQIALLTKYLYELSYTTSTGQVIQPILKVRSLTEPLGDPPGTFNPLSVAGRQKIAVLRHPRTKATYLATAPNLSGKVTRFDLITGYDPFSMESVALFNYIERQLVTLTQDPNSDWYKASFDFVGTTAGIRDLKEVTSSDETLIQRLVVLAVLAVLVVLLRRPMVSLYLILSVLFSYFITIGLTEIFFAWFYGATYEGLDWKVPIFLFVLLTAIGQDYNIYLVTRVFEEQERYGIREGLRQAVIHTGGIITSCGLIMAGTFVSMNTGTLRGMHELGFSLSFGVMLDTLVIRTVLVPAFLAIWQRQKPAAPEALAVPAPMGEPAASSVSL